MNISKLSMSQLKRDDPDDYRKKPKIGLFFVADHIRSGHNIGALFRIADAFNFQKVHVCGFSIQINQPEIQKTALGSTETVDWQYWRDVEECLIHLKNNNIKIIGIEQTNRSIELQNFNIEPRLNYALVLGNEVKGISDSILNLCDEFIEIPQVGTKHSINVSVAAGIVAWEFFKKKNY